MNKLKVGERAAAITVGATLFLAVVKGAVGYVVGSSALITSAFESLSDVISSVSSWFGLRIAQRKPDEKFPYGYYKAENIAALFISLLILYAAVNFMVEGYSRLMNPVAISNYGIGVAAALVSIAVSIFLYRFLSKVARDIGAQSIEANAKDKKVDIFSSSLVLVAIVSPLIGMQWLEGVVTILISFLVLKLGLETTRDSVLALMDVSPSKEIEGKVETALRSVSEAKRFKHLKLRKSGPFVFGEVEVEITGSIDVKRAHSVTEAIQNAVKGKVTEMEHFTVHVEPYKPRRRVVAIPVREFDGLDSRTAERVGRAHGFLLVTLMGSEVGKVRSIVNSHKENKSQAGLRAANLVAREGVDVLIVHSIGEISFHTLRDSFVEVYKSKGRTAREEIMLFIAGKLNIITKPTKESAGVKK